MEKYVFEIRLSRLKDTKDGFAFRTTQSNLFGGVTQLLIKSFKIDKKTLKDGYFRDDLQVFQIEGTKEYCDEVKQKVEGIDKNEIKQFLDKSTAVRSLPSYVRRKVTELRYAAMDSGFTRLQNGLSLFRISISCDVKKLEAEQVTQA